MWEFFILPIFLVSNHLSAQNVTSNCSHDVTITQIMKIYSRHVDILVAELTNLTDSTVEQADTYEIEYWHVKYEGEKLTNPKKNNNRTFSGDITNYNNPKRHNNRTFSGNIITYNIYDLEPFSRYDMKISSLGIDRCCWISSFTTNASTPGAVRDLTMYSANKTAASIRWMAPFPPTGVIELYTIELDNKTRYTITNNETICCKIWSSFLCYDIPLIGPGSLNLSVRALNHDVDDYGGPAFVLVTSGEREPSPPLSLSLEWTRNGTSNLTVKWQHPDQPYGPIVRFNIEVHDCKLVIHHNVAKEALNYTREVDVGHCQSPLQTLTLAISAWNAIGESNKSTHDIDIEKPWRAPPSKKSTYLWLLFVIPVACLIISGIIVKKICFSGRRMTFGFSSDRDDRLSLESNSDTDESSPYDVVVLNEEKFSKVIKVEDYVSYVKNSVELGLLETQYEMFPNRPLRTQDYGSKPENKYKNRYSKLIAYDDTRVRLNLVSEDPFSDYINANYIDGYKSEKTYIATQGPMENTTTDFWRMIWQENVKHIIVPECMFEEGKRKFEKYWPEINGYLEFDDIRIAYVKVEVMVNYEVRHFELTRNNQDRSVQQYHFLSTPDYNRVSLYVHNLASFLRKILSIPQGKSPIVVQCSDGIGRSGIVILSDICLRMATKAGKVDVLNQLYKLRRQRFNMVGNVDQYKLVHFVLLQILQSIQIPSQTGIVCNRNMEKKIENILKTKLPHQMKYISSTSWQDKAMLNINLKATHFRSNFKKKLADDTNNTKDRLTKVPSYSLNNDPFMFINTTAVDSYSTPSRFMITAKPSKAAIGIFWQLVVEKQIKVIVCLNELTFFHKDILEFNPLEGIKIEVLSNSANAYFEVYKLAICRDDKERRDLSVIRLTNWQMGALHPENPNDLINAYEEMNRLGKTSNTILITCHDGIRASGLFVAMCFLIEKIATVQICDVCLAVRSVRHGKKEFVTKIEQLAFLYLCGLEYIRQFRTYSNFNSESEM